ncbi:hypothetical protein [Shewanella sp. 38A_GOM-205m]|uniref:hypothetical protein n=1 Tax=Shewanella sp. 38A_GOM-205m TaxID=1380363 RepID=UPI0004916D0E|nr:hypothetical protein [Shewanella sp. 38A_GOM-205m]
MSKANTLFIGLDVHKETTDVARVSDKSENQKIKPPTVKSENQATENHNRKSENQATHCKTIS